MCYNLFQSAKDKERLDVPEDQRPVEKPKDAVSPKKKGKLKKIKFMKKKKKKGPTLLDIEEEKDGDISKVDGEVGSFGNNVSLSDFSILDDSVYLYFEEGKDTNISKMKGEVNLVDSNGIFVICQF